MLCVYVCVRTYVCVCVSVCFNRCSTESWNWIPIPVQIKGRKTTLGRWPCPPTNSSLLHCSSCGLLLDTEELKKMTLDQLGSTVLFFPFPIYFYYSFFLSLITHVLYGTVSLSVIFVWKKMSTRNLLSYPYHRHALATLLWPFACHTMSCNIFTCRPKKTFSARPCLSEYKPYNNIQHYRCDRLDPFFFFSSLINDFSNMLIFSISFCTEGSFVFFPFWML